MEFDLVRFFKWNFNPSFYYVKSDLPRFFWEVVQYSYCGFESIYIRGSNHKW